jgi:hypothetical protein
VVGVTKDDNENKSRGTASLRFPLIIWSRGQDLNLGPSGYAALSGVICLIFSFMVRDASHRSTARWALSQNSGELPNNRESRIAISGLTERRSRSNSLTVWRDTPNAFANADIVRP